MKWFRLYHDLLNDPKVQELRPELFKAWINLLCLASSRDERGTLPCASEIAFALRLRNKDAVRFLGELEDRSLVVSRSSGDESSASGDDSRTSEGWFIHGWDARQRDSDADKTSAERQRRHRAQERVTEVSRVTLPDVTRADTDTEKIEITPPTPSPGVRVPTPYSEEFSRFWAAYPRGEKKPDAWRAWQRHKPDIDAVLAALPAWKRSEQWRKGKVPHPATWLNARQWEDTPYEPPAPTPMFMNQAEINRGGQRNPDGTPRWSE